MYRVLIIRSLAFILSPLIWSPLNSTRNRQKIRPNNLVAKKGESRLEIKASLYWCINMPYSLFSTGVVKVWYTNYIELFSCWMSDWQYAQFQSLKLGHWLKTLFEGQKSVELYIISIENHRYVHFHDVTDAVRKIKIVYFTGKWSTLRPENRILCALNIAYITPQGSYSLRPEEGFLYAQGMIYF